MKRFVEGENRHQSLLFPESLDDYIAEDNPVRVIDAYVDELDLNSLGFTIIPAVTGRPSYHPAVMLKLYIYGYLNRIQSSRRLERECQRNVELIWLTGRLMPDHKTIANFRKDNGAALRNACQQFVVLCRQLNLFSQAIVAIDGSKFSGVNSHENNFSKAKIKTRMAHLEKSLSRYFEILEQADREEQPEDSPHVTNIKGKINALKKHMHDLTAMQTHLEQSGEKQVSLTDPDSRSMKSKSSVRGVVGYNVQTAVDTQHHLIIAHEVTNDPVDRQQLAPMAQKAQSVLKGQALTVLADRGYYSGEQILACELEGIATYVPKPATSNARAHGRFDRRQFIYSHVDDEYTCPAGERLPKRMATVENGKKMYRYWSSHCRACQLKSQCTPGNERRVARWEHEAVLEDTHKRLVNHPAMMAKRQATVEHPFGTIKSWMGASHFLTKGLHNVGTEMSLHVLAYNLKRMSGIFGGGPLIKAVQA